MGNNIKHRLTTRQIGGKPAARVYRSLMKQAILMTLKKEQVDMPCVISVLIADDKVMREYNLKYRGYDKTTDVLSFPMQDFAAPGWKGLSKADIDLDTNTVPLGDIIISITTIKRNARRYNHTFEHETVRMIIHSTLHLLGYDHSELMTVKENMMMEDMGYCCGG